jgi:RNase H-fold protein (predicted Holliday junction resolvase)
VTFQDERYTSVEAAGMLAGLGLSRGKKKARADSIAAHIILTAWMEAHASPRPGDGVAIHEPPQRPGALDG